MAHQSYAKSVFDTVTRLLAENGGEVTSGAVSSAMFAQTRVEHKRVLNVLSDLTKAGRISRIRQGVYGKPGLVKIDKRSTMYNFIHMRRRVTVEDMMEVAEASRDYAREFLLLMTRNGALRKEQAPGMAATWVLINQDVPLPDDLAKAARLRKIRIQKKEAITSHLDRIETDMASVRQLLNDFYQEEEK